MGQNLVWANGNRVAISAAGNDYVIDMWDASEVWDGEKQLFVRNIHPLNCCRSIGNLPR